MSMTTYAAQPAAAKAASPRAASPKVAPAGSQYKQVAPKRILDTRAASLQGTCNPSCHTLNSGQAVVVQVAGGSSPIPAGATAVVANLTSVTPGGTVQPPDFATIYAGQDPSGAAHPTASILNHVGSEGDENLVYVPIGNDGFNTIYNNQGTADYLLDVFGYFATPAAGATDGAFVALNPARIADTRTVANGGTPTPYNGQTICYTAGSNPGLDISVLNGNGVPANGVEAVVFNLTETGAPPGANFLAVTPAGGTPPVVSNLNFFGGETRAIRVTVGVPTSGANAGKVHLTFNNSSNAGCVDVIADINGYYTDNTAAPGTGSFFVPLTPTRDMNTQSSAPASDRGTCSGSPCTTLGPGGTRALQVTGSVVPSNATALVSNLTVNAPAPSAPSFATVFPDGVTRPTASDQNYYGGGNAQFGGQTIPNLVIVKLPSSGIVDFYNNVGTADFINDVYGYFVPAGGSSGGGTAANVSVTATPATLPADGSSTSNIVATVTDNSNPPNNVSGDTVNFTLSGTACGTLSASSAPTGTNGQASVQYTAANNAGTCTITATETQNGKTGSTNVTQTASGLTLTPASQTKAADGTATAVLTAKATNSNGTPRAGVTITFTILSGPNAGGSGTTNLGSGSNSCVTDASGTCTFTYKSTKVGADQVQASYTQGGTTYTATATVTWTAGPAAKLCIGPTDFVNSGTIPGCATTTSIDIAAQGVKINTQVTVSATAYDVNGNPAPGASVTFSRYFAPSSAYNVSMAASNCDPAENNGTSGCTFVTSQTVTADAMGHAVYSFTETQQGLDEVQASTTTATGQAKSGWTLVEWGLASITVTPAFPGGPSSQPINTPQTYNVTSTTDAGTPNNNCVEIAFSENYNNQTPFADQTPGGTSAYFSDVSGTGGAVPGGKNAFSNSGCTTPITNISTTKPKTIYVIPAPNGTFSFTINDQAADFASPIGAVDTSAGGGDFYNKFCDNFLSPCGPTFIGQTVKYVAPTTQSASITPTTPATQSAGSTRDYSVNNTLSGSNNTNTNFPNDLSFQELVGGAATTPGRISYVTVTSGGVTYCVQGYNPGPNVVPGTKCAATDATHQTKTTGVAFTPTGGSQAITVTYSSYGSATNTGPNAFTMVSVTGTGQFTARIVDSATCATSADNPNGFCTGTSTPVTWIEQNGDRTLETATEPNAVGGAISWIIPVGTGLTLFSTNYRSDGTANNAANGGEDRYSDGQFYNTPNPNPKTQADQDIRAVVSDQNGQPFVGSSTYGIQWTITNNGATATKVYLQDVGSPDAGNNYVDHQPPGSTVFSGLGTDNDLGGATTDHFVNPKTGTNNATIPKNTAVTGPYASVPTTITIPGGQSLTFVSYTDGNGACGGASGFSYDCGVIVISSPDATQATVTAQLQDATSGSSIGTSASDKYNWVAQPTAAQSVQGTLTAFDPVELGADPTGTGTNTDPNSDWLIVNTTVGKRMVQFGQLDSSTNPPQETYEVNGTSADEDQFEAALANGKTVKVTNFNCVSPGNDANGTNPSCTAGQDNQISG